MINKKFGLILAAGIFSLAACGEEQPAANESPEEVAEQENTTEEETTAAEEETMEESAPVAESGAASALLSTGEQTRYIFNEAGEYAIFCEPHPAIQMTVLVEEGAEQAGEVAIDIADFEFSEEAITVAPGTTIVWANQDQVQHNVAIK